MFQLGDKVLYDNSVYVLALFLSDNKVNIIKYNDINVSLRVDLEVLKPYSEKHEEVFTRLRTNEALEEDLIIATEKIVDLQKTLALTRAAVADSLSHLEDSENPFYLGIKTLKGLLDIANKK